MASPREQPDEKPAPAVINERALVPVRILATMAFALWLLSLRLPALGDMLGLTVLLLGWMVLSIPWLANFFFLYAAVTLLVGRLATRSAVAAALLSLITFTDVVAPQFHAYGWGAVAWFMAMFLALAAALTLRGTPPGQGAAARGPNRSNEPYGFRLALSLVPFLAGALVFGFFAVHDRLVANAAETGLLRHAAFKRGAVCRVEQPEIRSPLPSSVAPLEIVLQPDGRDFNAPYRNIRGLLNVGVPTVRLEGRDYRASLESDGLLVQAVPASGPAVGTLSMSRRSSGGREELHVALADPTGRVVFAHVWEGSPSTGFCPDYEPSSTEPAKQPVASILAGLGIQRASGLAKYNATPVLEGTVTKLERTVDTRSARLQRWLAGHADQGLPPRKPPLIVATVEGCPPGVGWTDENSEYGMVRNLGWGFSTPAGVFYPASDEFQGVKDYRARCVGDFVYLYKTEELYEVRTLKLEKRRLPDFSRVWSYAFRTKALTLPGNYEITSVDETEGAMMLELQHEEALLAYRVELRTPGTSNR